MHIELYLILTEEKCIILFLYDNEVGYTERTPFEWHFTRRLCLLIKYSRFILSSLTKTLMENLSNNKMSHIILYITTIREEM